MKTLILADYYGKYWKPEDMEFNPYTIKLKTPEDYLENYDKMWIFAKKYLSVVAWTIIMHIETV